MFKLLCKFIYMLSIIIIRKKFKIYMIPYFKFEIKFLNGKFNIFHLLINYLCK